MSNLTRFIAAIARHPVNAVKAVARDIDTLNREAAEKPTKTELSEEEREMIEAMRKRKK